MKIFKYLISAAFTLTLLISNSLSADGKIDNIDAELAAFNDRFNEVVAEKNMDGFLALYAEDSLWIAPNTPPSIGHGEPRATFNFIIENDGKLTHTVDTLHISDDGSQAVMIGTADVLVEKAGMKAQGTYLFVLERNEDSWIIVTDMWHQHSEP